jgi:hypothetical protein
MPADGDSLAAASVQQPMKEAMDYIAYLQDRLRDTFFGNGSDGALVINDAATHDLSGMKFYDTVNISIGSLRTNGWPVIARTSITVGGSGGIWGHGGNASGATRGTYFAAEGPHGSISPCNGLASGSYPHTGQSFYGFGGNGGAGGGAAPSGTSIVSPGNGYKIYPWRFHGGGQAVGTLFAGNANVYPGIQLDALRGGGAGAPGGVVASSVAGAGGAAGSLVILISPSITFANGCSMASNGGNGGTGVATNGNGGGGGGGGAFLLVYKTLSDSGAIYSATGGTAGFGIGTGAAGISGTNGNTAPFTVTVP